MRASSRARRSTRRSTAATVRRSTSAGPRRRRRASASRPSCRARSATRAACSARAALERFLDEAGALGDRLAVLLVQLPPSLAFETRRARAFFDLARRLFAGAIVCEPRHPSWFTTTSDRVLAAARVGRVATDPVRAPSAVRPGGWLGPTGDGRGAVVYHRWHGVPATYRSRYDAAWIAARAAELASWPPQADVWCVFDNTASGAAAVNALELRAAVATRAST